MNQSAIFLVLLLAAPPLQAAQDRIKVVYDQSPDSGIPFEAELAYSKDGKDYGSLRVIVNPDDVLFIKVRYYDDSFKNIQEVQSYLTSVLRSEKGSTVSYIPWAEGLSVPSVEATVYFKSGEKGRWLFWHNRSAFQDKQMKWWFGYDF